MDVSGARKFRVSVRLLLSILTVCSLLLASAFWNFHLYRRAEHERLRAIAAEQTPLAHTEEERLRALAEEKAKPALTEAQIEQARMVAKRQAERAKDAERVRELYQELNNLSQMSEQILLENPNLRDMSRKKSKSAESAAP